MGRPGVDAADTTAPTFGAHGRGLLLGHPLRGRVVMHGGRGTSGWLTDTWEWDGTDWTERQPAHDGHTDVGGVMAFDHALGRVLLLKTAIGAHWDYGAVNPASVTSFGFGCTGTAGPATLEALSSPWLADRFRLHHAPPIGGRPAFAIFGASRSSWGAFSLPLDLAPIGMPGCALLASADLVLPFPSVPLLDLPVPADVRLVGSTLYAQAWIADPAANLFGAIASNGLAVTIGAR